MRKHPAALVALALVAAVAATPPTPAQQVLFGDGFECGYSAAWDVTSPAPPPRPGFDLPPAAIGDVLEVLPLGAVYPASQHTIPVDHMYLQYLVADGDGTDSVRVQAMADGAVTMIGRSSGTVPTSGGGVMVTDYEIYVVHDGALASQVDHLHELDSAILAHADGHWFVPFEGADGEVVIFGQNGAPAPYELSAGDTLGFSRNYFANWDLGVMDLCRTHHPVNPSPRRYPDIADFAVILGIPLTEPPYPGHRTLNAACFIDYLPAAIRATWLGMLASTPQTCGRAIWDVEGTLQGTWFNPALDTEPAEVVFEIENAALVLVPTSLDPENRIDVGFKSGHPLALLSPTADAAVEAGFRVTFDPTPGALVDPHPLDVGPATQVCYDLERLVGSGWDRLFLEIQGDGSLRARYEKLEAMTQECPETPAVTWGPSDPTFVR